MTCPALLFPETQACVGGSCDVGGTCACDPGYISQADFASAGGQCVDESWVSALWALSAVSFVVANCASVHLLNTARTARSDARMRVYLGTCAFTSTACGTALGIIRAVHPDWAIGTNVLSSVLLTVTFLLFWAFCFGVATHVLFLAQRIEVLRRCNGMTRVALQYYWPMMSALSLFSMTNLAPVIMLGASQSLAELGALFYWGNAVLTVYSGLVSLRYILLPVCDVIKNHAAGARQDLHDTLQLKRVALKMERFALQIQLMAVIASSAIGLVGSWPLLIRYSAYVLPLNQNAIPIVVLAACYLFAPVKRVPVAASPRFIGFETSSVMNNNNTITSSMVSSTGASTML